MGIIRNHRFEDKLERGYQILDTLLATSLVREDAKGDRISFLHPSFQSFFLAASVLRQSYEQFEEFVNSHTGSVYLALNPGYWRSVGSTNWEAHESLKFILALSDRKRDSQKYDFLLARMFEAEPLLLKECWKLLDRKEVIARLRSALRFETEGEEREQFAFWTHSHTFFCKDDESPTLYPVESSTQEDEPGSGGDGRLDPRCRTWAADEAAFELVKKLGLNELAPDLLDYFCRTMQRGELPYIDQDGLWDFGEDRFKELLRMCKPDQIVTVLLDILQTGSPYQRQNAALIFNWHVFKEFGPGAGKEEFGPGAEKLKTSLRDPDRTTPYRVLTFPGSGPHNVPCSKFETAILPNGALPNSNWQYWVLREWRTHQSLGAEVSLVLELVPRIPESLPASSLEGILRVLQIFRSILVTEPLQTNFSRRWALDREGRTRPLRYVWDRQPGYDLSESQFEDTSEKTIQQYLNEGSSGTMLLAPYRLLTFFGEEPEKFVKSPESQEGQRQLSCLSKFERMCAEVHRGCLSDLAEKAAEEVPGDLSRIQGELAQTAQYVELRNQLTESGIDDELLTLLENENFLSPEREELMIEFFGSYCCFDSIEEIPELERIAVEWSFFELPKLICRFRAELVRQLSDPIQRIDAAKAVTRLYLEGLWTQEQAFWQRTLEKVWDEEDQSWRLGFVEEESVWPEEARQLYPELQIENDQTLSREVYKRKFETFMASCPHLPSGNGGRTAIEFLEAELALNPPPVFRTAAQLLIAHFRAD